MVGGDGGGGGGLGEAGEREVKRGSRCLHLAANIPDYHTKYIALDKRND